MNNNSFLLYASIVALICSCSPKVSNTITKNYPPQAPNAPVTVYTKPQDVPLQSEVLGTLAIDDTGFTTNCDSATVFSLAKSETRKVGGNGFLVTTYSKPSFFGSSCHRIAGNMLYVSDFTKPITETGVNIDLQSETSSSETVQFVQVRPADISDLGIRRPKRQLSRLTFALDAGYGWRTAKTNEDLTSYEKDFIGHLKSGFVWDASVNYYFNDHYGIGLTFYQFRSKHSDNAQHSTSGKTGILEAKDRITYIGPAFVMRFPFGNNAWTFDLNVGMGYIGYKEVLNFPDLKGTADGASVGFQTGLGLSYKFAPQWGIGFNIQATSGVLTEMNTEENGVKSTEKFEAGKGEGLGQISLSLGIRFYIQ